MKKNSPKFMAVPSRLFEREAALRSRPRARLIANPDRHHAQEYATRGPGFEAHLPRPWRRHFDVHGFADTYGLTGRSRHLATGRQLGAVLRDHAPRPHD